MNKKNDSKILKFPNTISQLERQVEAILFAAEEPLDVESIQEKLKTRANISKILESLDKQYKNRGINLVCIANKWSFRTASNLSKFINLPKISGSEELKLTTLLFSFILLYIALETTSHWLGIRLHASARGHQTRTRVFLFNL